MAQEKSSTSSPLNFKNIQSNNIKIRRLFPQHHDLITDTMNSTLILILHNLYQETCSPENIIHLAKALREVTHSITLIQNNPTKIESTNTTGLPNHIKTYIEENILGLPPQ